METDNNAGEHPTPEEEQKTLEQFLEGIAQGHHAAWIDWSREIAKTETISPERPERWKKCWVPYDKLSEADKEKDREYARLTFVFIALREGRL